MSVVAGTTIIWRRSRTSSCALATCFPGADEKVAPYLIQRVFTDLRQQWPNGNYDLSNLRRMWAPPAFL
eukprot:9431745-Lingulodinium_polyedra.AAC.1